MTREPRLHVSKGRGAGNKVAESLGLQRRQANVVELARRELRVIQDVVGLGAHFEIEPVAYSEALDNAHVEVVDGRQSVEIDAAGIAERSRRASDKFGIRITGLVSDDLSLCI